MGALAVGTYVALTPGTTALVKHEGEEKYERQTVNDDWEGTVLQVVAVGVSHSTMNGGGRDYRLADPWSAAVTRVRTTLARPENQTFITKTKQDAGVYS
jgi:hypothetical protein